MGLVSTEGWTTATAVLRMANQLVDGIQQGGIDRGYTDVRPVHGFAFARLSQSPATTAQLAEHLGITKQATSELVQYLVDHAYVTRTPAPGDRRARLLVLTEQGHACTRAAQLAAEDIVETWMQKIPPDQRAPLHAALATIAEPGPIRPSW